MIKRLTTSLIMFVVMLSMACPALAYDAKAYGNFNGTLVITGTEGDTMTHVRASVANYTNATTGLVTEAAVDIPRFEDPDGDGVLELLVEPEHTNLCLYSQQFDHATWSKRDATVTANNTTAPDGNDTADKLVEDSTPATSHYTQQDIAATGFTNDASVTFSVYAKQAGRTWIRVMVRNKDAVYSSSNFDLANGVVGITSGVDYENSTIESAANGFYRCSLTVDIGGGATDPCSFYIHLAEANNDTTFDGDGTSGVYLWQADVIEAPIPMSPVVTTNATATCATESGYPTLPLTAGLQTIFAGAGTAILEFRPAYAEANAAVDCGILSCADAVASLLYHDVSGNGVASHDGTTEATQALAFVSGTQYKLIVKWGYDDGGEKFRVGVDSGTGISWGTEQAFDSSHTIGTVLHIGYGLPGPMHLQDLYIYDAVPSDYHYTASTDETINYSLFQGDQSTFVLNGIYVPAAATGVSIVNTTVANYIDRGIVADESCTVTNCIGYGNEHDISIASGKTVTGTYSFWEDSVKVGTGTYTDASGIGAWNIDDPFRRFGFKYYTLRPRFKYKHKGTSVAGIHDQAGAVDLVGERIPMAGHISPGAYQFKKNKILDHTLRHGLKRFGGVITGE